MQASHVPHSIFIKPLRVFDVWPENPNYPNDAITPSIGETNKIRQINTYDDWHIVPLSRPLVNPPVFKENYLDLPGVYGSLDYSRAHMGIPVYGNRTGQWEFVVLNDFRSWEEAYSDIQHTVHGKRCFITLEDDPEYFYVGNLKLNEWRSDPGWSRIVIEYNLEPYKYCIKKAKLELDLSGENTEGINLNPTLLGRAPTRPWIKISPQTRFDPILVNVACTNVELQTTRDMSIDKGDVYVSAPEFILSNESGANEVAILFTGTSVIEETGPVHIELLYTRGYM